MFGWFKKKPKEKVVVRSATIAPASTRASFTPSTTTTSTIPTSAESRTSKDSSTGK